MGAPITQQWNLVRDSALCVGGVGPTRYRRVRQLYTNLPANSAIALQHGLLTENQTPATPIDANLDAASNSVFNLVPQANNLSWDSNYIYINVQAATGTHSVYVTIMF